jgi:hypothetical protein
MRFQFLTTATIKFRIVFRDVLPCKIIVDNYFTRQYIPEYNSELDSWFFLYFSIQTTRYDTSHDSQAYKGLIWHYC